MATQMKDQGEIKSEVRSLRKLQAPSGRNLQIHRAYRVEEKPLRQVAAEFGLSHPRIVVIVKQVERWLGETVGRGGTGDWLQRKGVAEYLHRERLHHLYRKALEFLERSGQDVQTKKIRTKDGVPEVKELTIKTGQGNWKYLELALRAEDLRMKFDYESGAIQPPYGDELTGEEQGSATKQIELATSEEIPAEKTEEVQAAVNEDVPDESPREEVCPVVEAGVVAEEIATQPVAPPPLLWRFAERDDFSVSRRIERARREHEAKRARGEAVPAQIVSVAPLEVLPRLFVVPGEPLRGSVEETKFKQRWRAENWEFIASRNSARSEVGRGEYRP